MKLKSNHLCIMFWNNQPIVEISISRSIFFYNIDFFFTQKVLQNVI